MNWPPTIPPCPKPLREFLQALIDRISASWPIDGFGIKCTDSKEGRVINAQTGGDTAGTLHPLQLVAAEEGFYRIVYGTVAGLSDPFSPGDEPPYVLEVADGHKVYCDLTMEFDSDVGIWEATALTFASAETVPDGTETNAYREIGSVSLGGAPASSTIGSMEHKRCGDDTNFLDYFQG